MSAATELMTAEELFFMGSASSGYELVKGELKKMSPTGGEHGAVVVNLTVPLGHHVKANKLGIVFGAETGFKLATNPDTVRAPDIAFVRRERIPAEGRPKSYWIGPPDLAVEVLSPGDAAQEVEEKVHQYLESGSLMVWVVNPKHQTVTVYRSLTDIKILTAADTLEGQDVVEGFRCSVAEIFE
jgi:Uma2 family endonuclease